jgi:DNA-binding LacI/PurR family transcriptional regulator
MVKALLPLQPRPTAVLAANNFIAIGAYAALREAGLRIPEDISLVTFDDLPAKLMLEPFLTTVDQSAYEMGYQATQLLLTHLSGETPAQPRVIVLPTRLIIRSSSGKAPLQQEQ